MVKNINEKRKATKASNMILVKTIIESHHTKRTGKIKSHLAKDYGIKLTADTISRYKLELATIEKRHNKEKRTAEKAQHQAERKEKTALVKEVRKLPMKIKDPSGKEWVIHTEIESISLTWNHEPLTWGPISQNMAFWHWRNSGQPFDKKNVSKVHSWRLPKSKMQQWFSGNSE